METAKPHNNAQQRLQLHLHKQARRLANLEGVINKLLRPRITTSRNDVPILLDQLAAVVQHVNNDDPLSELDRTLLQQLLSLRDNEHIIRAITSRLFYREFGANAGKEALDTERRKGFKYIDALYAQLVKYEQARAQYPTLESFYPRLLGTFSEFKE